MKKRNLTLVLLFIIALVFFVWRYSTRSTLGVAVENTQPSAAVKSEATISVSDGDTTLSSDKIEISDNTTVYDLLKSAVGKHNFSLETKQYDFGVFVQSINGKVSSANQAWIYYINGQSGQEAADKYPVKNGDNIEWKYVKPTDNF